MKNKQVLKSFSDLSFDGTVVTGAGALASNASPLRPKPGAELALEVPEFGDVREMLDQRYTAPLVVAAPYRHWGINE